MSNQQNNPGTRSGMNKPTMFGYVVRPIGNSGKSSWNKIAAAWAHKDGQGFEVRMDAVPVDGRLVLRAAAEDDQPLVENDGPAPS
ncbi:MULTISPECIES: hypothetical protein [Paracoccaceae]|uniref:hypothetical protein n=1 Tax=Paracoccaceae TaxID=31989 RepID=UPI003297DA6C